MMLHRIAASATLLAFLLAGTRAHAQEMGSPASLELPFAPSSQLLTPPVLGTGQWTESLRQEEIQGLEQRVDDIDDARYSYLWPILLSVGGVGVMSISVIECEGGCEWKLAPLVAGSAMLLGGGYWFVFALVENGTLSAEQDATERKLERVREQKPTATLHLGPTGGAVRVTF